MRTLADKPILAGADNHPPMLEKYMYDSWKSQMELYMMNRQHGRMILESVKNGPLIWPSIKENGVTRPKRYYELFATEAIQADYDVKATNIILQVKNGPLIWPTIKENAVTKTKKYADIYVAEKIQAYCDMKASNIILQGLPADIYSLLNHYRFAKDLWKRVQLLMQGSYLTK
nr:hypothetical protein [Tanacetum cinerariifolium]